MSATFGSDTGCNRCVEMLDNLYDDSLRCWESVDDPHKKVKLVPLSPHMLTHRPRLV